MTDHYREELIEKAVKAMREVGELGCRRPDAHRLAEAALAVFEQAEAKPKQNDANDFANTPTAAEGTGQPTNHEIDGLA